MRICFISSYPPNRARLSEHARSLVKELADRSKISKIYVLADMVNNSKNRASEGSKIEILRVWQADNPISILGIVPHILKLKPDVAHFNVHFQSYGRRRIANFIGLMLAPICKLLGLKVVVTIHNFGEIVDLEKVHVRPNLINRLGIFIATRLMLSFASKIVVTVKLYVDYLKKRYKCKKIRYIPHGAPNHNCTSLNDPPNEKVILMFGHMGPHKGLPILLEAFKELLKERDDVKLVIAGSSHPNFPGYLETFKRQTMSKISFIGYVQEKDLPQVFEMASVVVLPYLTATGTSGVFHLACGYGKPVVASDLPEIREMVAHGASAVLVPPGDIRALKEAILDVLDDSSLSEYMKRKNLAYAMHESWESVAKSYELLYLQLLNKRDED